MLPTSLLIWINMRTQTEECSFHLVMHGRCQAWGPQCKSVPCWTALFFQPKIWTPFNRKVPLVLLESLQINTAKSTYIAACLWTPRGLGGKEGVCQQAVITTVITVGMYFAQRVCVMGKQKNGPSCGHLYPFLLLCLVPNTGEYTQARKESTCQ